MTERESAAIDIHDLARYPKFFDAGDRLAAEGFVDFDHIEIIDRKTRTRERLARGRDRPHSHIFGLDARDRARTDTRQHRQSVLRSEEHTSELQSLMRISYADFRLKNTNSTHARSASNLSNTHMQ